MAGDLAIRSPGNLGNDMHLTASPLRRERLPDLRGQVARAGLWNHEQHERLPGLGMRNRSRRALPDAANGRHLCLHVGETNANASDLHEVALAPLQPDVSVFVHRGLVSRLQPAIAELGRRPLGVAEISASYGRSLDPDFSGFTGRKIPAIVISDADC